MQELARSLSNEIGARVFWKYKEGINKVRILPPKPGSPMTSFCRKVKKHFKVGPNNSAVDCLRAAGQRCAVCEYMEQQAKLGIDVSDMEAEAQYEFAIICVDTLSGGVENLVNGNEPLQASIWAASGAQAGKILATIQDDSWGDISHPQTGKLCTVEKIVKGKTTIEIRFSPNNCPINLDRVVWPDKFDSNTYEEQVAILSGVKNVRSMAAESGVGSPAAATSNFPFEVTPPAQQVQQIFNPGMPATVTGNPAVGGMVYPTQTAPAQQQNMFDVFGGGSPVVNTPPVMNMPTPPAFNPPPVPVPTIPEVKEWQVLDTGGKPVGPFTVSEMKSLPFFNPGSMVWCPRLTGWTKFSDVK